MNVNDKAALTVAIDEFDEFFAAVNHGREPYAWQRALLRQVVTTGRWPDAVVAPTGAGKSSVLEVHVFAVAMTHAPGWEGARAPRRLWHVVGRRALVDDMASRAEAVFGQLAETTDVPGDAPLSRVAAVLRRISPAGQPGSVTTLRGGIAPERGWQDDPVSCQVICATPDMAGSRLLFRGYGSTAGMRPREAGLIAYDSVLILDEAHLNRQLLTTARRVASLAGESPLAAHVPVLQVVETTATPAGLAPAQTSIGVELSDIRTGAVGEALLRRLDRPKPVHLHLDGPWLVGGTARETTQGAQEIARMAADAVQAGHTPVGVVMNRVASALAVHRALLGLNGGLDVALVVGPRRRWEQALERSRTPDVYVATQAIEVGLDLDFGFLITDIASGSALAQRAGRLNRTGARESAPVHVLCPSADPTAKTAAPYEVQDITDALEWLRDRAEDPKGVSPAALLEHPAPSTAPARPVLSEIEAARAALFSRTSEALAVEPDLTLWLRDSLDAETDVAVVGRRLPRLGEDAGEYLSGLDQAESAALLTTAPPQPHEAYPVTLSRLRLLLAGGRRGRATPAFVRRGRQWTLVDPDASGHGIVPGDVVCVPHDWAATHHHVLVEDGQEPVGDVLDPRSPDGTMLSLEPVKASRRRVVFMTGVASPGVQDHLRCSLLEVCAGLQEADVPLTLPSVLDALDDRGQSAWLTAYLGQWADPDLAARFDVKVHVGGRAPDSPQQAAWVVFELLDAADPDDAQLSATTGRSPVSLADHQRDVADRAGEFAQILGLPESLKRTLTVAGAHHDDGKSDERYQAWLTQGVAGADEPMAKSLLSALPFRQSRFLPAGWRHEQLSAAMLRAHADGADALAVRLVGTSHGHGRGTFLMGAESLVHPEAAPHVRMAAEELFDVGVWDALVLSVEQTWGLWAVAWLEAVLRAADVTISKEGR